MHEPLSTDRAGATDEPTVVPDDDTVIDLTDGSGPAEPERDDDPLAEAAAAIEAIVMVATDPIPEQLLAQLVELPVATIRALCRSLADQYEQQHRGFAFVEVAGGWRYQSHPAQAAYVERFALEGQTAKLSGAALETLAIVAYKQPISRGQVSAIRGVNADGVLRTLEQRGYVVEVGRDDGPGQAILLGTTDAFCEKLGLASPDDLPPLGEFVPSAAVVEALEQSLRVEAPAAVHKAVDEAARGELLGQDTPADGDAPA